MLCLLYCVFVCGLSFDMSWFVSHFVLVSVLCQTFIFILPQFSPRQMNSQNYKHSNYKMHSLHLSFCLLYWAALTQQTACLWYLMLRWNRGSILHDRFHKLVRECEGYFFWSMLIRNNHLNTSLLFMNPMFRVCFID